MNAPSKRRKDNMANSDSITDFERSLHNILDDDINQLVVEDIPEEPKPEEDSTAE